MDALDILVWNMQNLFVFMDKYKGNGDDLTSMLEPQWQLLSTSLLQNKPIHHVRAAADLIKSVNPHVILMTEVGGRESLENFSKYFLNNEYEVYHEASNSDRGIDTGCLVKRKIPYPVRFKVHRHSVFARGVDELTLDCGEESLVFLLTHLKSKLNKFGKDFEGRGQRAKEVEKLLYLHAKACNKHQTKNVFICGDLNGIIYKQDSEQELARFSKYGIEDVLEILDRDLFDRYTYAYFDRTSGKRHCMQLDYMLTSPNNKSTISSESSVLDFEGNIRTQLAADIKEKWLYPSDHYPLFCRLTTFKPKS